MMIEPQASVIVMNVSAEITSSAAVFLFSKNLRNKGISCVSDIRNVKLKKKLEIANKSKCYYSVIIGQTELETNSVQIKDMDSGLQFSYQNEEALDFLYYHCKYWGSNESNW